MKLLYDHNLSPRLVANLEEEFPGSDHVFHLGLHERVDLDLWRFAREEGFTVVSKDADFVEISLAEGFPPKLLWVRLGNCTTVEIESVLRTRRSRIIEFDSDAELGVLALLRER